MVLKVSKRVISITAIVAVFAAIILLFAKQPDNNASVKGTNSDAVVVQVLAKAGYTPDVLIAPANKKVTLRVETKNTYDCSAAFAIPRLKVEKLLPANGFTDFEIPPQPAGTTITAGCSMGMYGLQVKFQ